MLHSFAEAAAVAPSGNGQTKASLVFTASLDGGQVQCRARRKKSDLRADLVGAALGCCLCAAGAASALCQLLTTGPRLTGLDLGGNCFTERETTQIWGGLLYNRSLLVLDYRANTVTAEAASVLGMALEAGSDLRTVNLAACRITDAAIAQLARANVPGSRLESLVLHNNSLTSASVARIREAALGNLSGLQELHLRGNALADDRGAVAPTLVAAFPRLTTVDLSQCGMTEEGVWAVLEAVQRTGGGLLKVAVSGNGTDKRGHAARLAEKLRQSGVEVVL